MDPEPMEADIESARAWWASLAPSVPRETIALWFGIVDLVVDGVITRQIYASGTPEFDESDETGDCVSDH